MPLAKSRSSRLWSALEPSLCRLAVFGTAIVSTCLAGGAMWHLLALNGFGALEQFLFLAFVTTFLWISIAFWSALAGFFSRLTAWHPQGLQRPDNNAADLATRTAILMPIYNEDPARVFANLQAMHEALVATGQGRQFDFFVLSDTTDPAIWLAEEATWFAVKGRLEGGGAVHYRRRTSNRGRKAGNIADFCQRWGGHYDFMVVLDADSLMAADTLIAMARTMEANPRCGLIQVPPVLINRHSLFARLQQFASNLVGPLAASGQAYWQQGDGNFWGHNAIIRIRAFADSCGLPSLPGRKPFGGQILSHDFVEAALLRRAGWQIWMLPELGGSYEESPPTLLDYAIRDRRWCQGNLQHSKIVPAAGLHPVSRAHLVFGIFSYLVSPIWFLFLIVGLAAAVSESLGSIRYFVGDLPFPVWPQSDPQLAIALFMVALGMLLTPKLLGWFLVIGNRERARAFGGRIRVTLSLLLETAIATLLAPAMMLYHSMFVIEVLLGRDSGWSRQTRTEADCGVAEAVWQHRWQLAAGVLLGGTLTVLPTAVFWWFLPLLAGLLLAPFLASVTSSSWLGRFTQRLGLFLIPEEVTPSALVERANRLAAEAPAAVPARALPALQADPRLAALHQAITAASGEPAPAANLVAQAKTRLRQAGPEALTSEEEAALLADLPTLSQVLDATLPSALPWPQPPADASSWPATQAA